MGPLGPTSYFGPIGNTVYVRSTRKCLVKPFIIRLSKDYQCLKASNLLNRRLSPQRGVGWPTNHDGCQNLL
jgi:hypothetical protein